MKLRILSLAVLSAISLSAYADTGTASSMQDQVSALQNQINSLQSQLNNMNNHSALNSIIMTDFSSPLGLLNDSQYALGTLLNKSTLNTPIVVGGSIESDLQTWGGSFSVPNAVGNTTYQSGSAFSVTGAELYTMANMGDWVTGLLGLQGNVGGNSGSPMSFDKAFLLFGNLQKNPLFVTVGEIYLPFGIFNGNGPWSNNLDTDAFRISKTNQLTLNFYNKGFYTSFAWFNTAANNSGLHDFTYNISYAKSGTFNYSVGAGYLYDIRNTNSGIGAAYPGAGVSGNTAPSTYTISGNRNGAFDLNGSIAYGHYNLNGEYDFTERGASNLNGSNTGPMGAWNIAAGYGTLFWNIPTNFQLGYSATHNMSNIPAQLWGMDTASVQTQTSDNNAGVQHNWLVSMTNQFFPNVYMSPEYQYSTLYNGTHTWTLTYDISAYF
ncbi:MAG: FlxA-like family protein [Gammaproteobacteria bacterium]|jgi:hypothetical protein|nr:FlxA-like family protein [Gammaproteobacteria bacterium]